MITKTEAVLSAAVITATGPLLGDYVVIGLCGLLGAMASLRQRAPGGESDVPTSWFDALTFIASTVGLALSVTWIVATAISSQYPAYSTSLLLPPVAFFSALFSRRIMKILPALVERFGPWKK